MLDNERYPLRLTTMILGEFTMCEGAVDDILGVYVRPIAPPVLAKIGLRLSGVDTVAFLNAVVEWEAIPDMQDLPAAWKRAVGVRNDLAHSNLNLSCGTRHCLCAIDRLFSRR